MIQAASRTRSGPLKIGGGAQGSRVEFLDMNRSQIESAIERNLPFSLRMADGQEYQVPHRDYISLPPRGGFVVVYDDREHVFVLPLLTMTGLTYQSETAGAKGSS